MTKQLSKNFTLEQLIKSDTAIRLGITNIPNPNEMDNLAALCENILEKVYEKFGKMEIHSGFRCLKLNRLVGSKDTSDHVKGCAADIEVPGISNKELALWVADNLKYNQVILEFYTPEEGGPNSGWVHVAYHTPRVGPNKMQRLIINKKGTSTF